ncbi:MAG TPA: sugar ABC transporter ATP-binding protein [Chloroflexota bacterium]|nr:sugar ABC transporter ATP-binding protein [Chloroflexota bacterium]
MAAESILQMRGVTKGFPGVQALKAVDFDVRRGEVHALVGHNGAGKSTLIKILTGAYGKDGGRVLLHAKEVSFASPAASQAAGIATIYQEVNLVPYLTAPENIFLGREPRTRFGTVNWARMRRDAAKLLESFGIRVDLTVPVSRIGVALQQMVTIARAVSLQASLVVMDEPTSSLDAAEVRVLFGVIRQLRAAGVAIIYVSHRLEEIFALADRVTVLRDGKLVATIDISEVDILSLVALMLGRDPEQVRASGLTAFSQTGAASGETVLEIEHLSGDTIPRDISLRTHKGEVVGLAGLLGSGRTELARVIFGLDRAVAGTITIAGRRRRIGSPRAAVRAGMGYVTEDRKIEGIVPELSVRDNIMLAALPMFARLGVISPRRQRIVVDDLIRRLDIRTPGPATPVGRLSGGNQQKVILARWLCRQPRFLILDEPTRGIDVGAKSEIQRLIQELARDQGMSLLMISSELEEVVEGSDRVVVIKDGRKLGEFARAEASEDRVMKAISEG